ncbi:hypothetical protein K502DRAFT_324172 [Neoconidiobolus thromboides FSU 785]|nr:hypothetical protein K502DRAFT_324172 [Neoconidiobolus thromboides FSU 785]
MNTMNPETKIIINQEKKEESINTNCIVISCDDSNLFQQENLDQLKIILEREGRIKSYCPIKKLRRIIIIFEEMEDEEEMEEERIYGDIAKEIKRKYHLQKFDSYLIKVYLLEPILNKSLRKNYLNVMNSERLFLISPPNSPPSGWLSSSEDAPNTLTFSSDLINKLNKLNLQNNAINSNEDIEIKFEASQPKFLIQDWSGPNHSSLISMASPPPMIKTSFPPFSEF